jgi:PadR family transcriptional regulator PadR
LAPDQTNLLQGTLDMMILKAPALGELYDLSGPVASSKSPRAHSKSSPARSSRLCIGWGNKAGRWPVGVESENKRRVKYYKPINAGRRRLEAETKRWDRMVLAITRTLEAS